MSHLHPFYVSINQALSSHEFRSRFGDIEWEVCCLLPGQDWNMLPVGPSIILTSSYNRHSGHMVAGAVEALDLHGAHLHSLRHTCSLLDETEQFTFASTWPLSSRHHESGCGILSIAVCQLIMTSLCCPGNVTALSTPRCVSPSCSGLRAHLQPTLTIKHGNVMEEPRACKRGMIFPCEALKFYIPSRMT